MIDQYYQLARRFGALSRQPLAMELRALHQDTVAATVERAADIVREGRENGTPLEEIEASIRSIELTGKQVIDDRLHLRHAEAVLWVMLGGDVDVSFNRGPVSGAFDRGDGVDLAVSRDGTVTISRQPGKFVGK